MAKSVDTDFRELMRSLGKGELAPVYLLIGEEEYYIDELVSWFENNVVDEADRDFNQYVYYGADTDADTVASSCRQLPVMAPRQLVVLKEVQSMAKASSQLDRLESYVKKPVASTILVVSYKGEGLPASSKFLKAVSNAGVVFKSPKIRDYQVSQYIKSYCTSRKISIDEKSLSLLAENLGTSLKRIFSEIDKLEISENRKIDRITPELIEKYIGISKDYNNYELVSALGCRNYLGCMKIVEYFRMNPKNNPTIKITPAIFSLFSKLAIVQSLPSKTDQAINDALGFQNFAAMRDLKTALRHYTLPQCVEAIGCIREFDARSKGIGSTQNEYDLLLDLVFKLITL